MEAKNRLAIKSLNTEFLVSFLILGPNREHLQKKSEPYLMPNHLTFNISILDSKFTNFDTSRNNEMI